MNHLLHWRRLAGLSIFLLSALWFSLASTSVYAAESTSEGEQFTLTSIKLNQLIIGVEPGQSDKDVTALIANRGLKLVKHWPAFGGALVEVSGAPTDSVDRKALQASNVSAQQAFAALDQARQSVEQLSGIRYASFNGRVVAASLSASNQFTGQTSDSPTPPLVEPLPDDTEFINQWALNIIRVVDSWNISQGDPNVVVAVIDSGYNVTHPDLDNSSLWTNEIEKQGLPGVDDDNNGFVDDYNGWDWVENDNVMNDTFGHGTHVGGTIAATTNNQLGISGIGRNIKVMPLRILDGTGGGDIADLVDALNYALTKNVRIANLSLVTPQDYPVLSAAVEAVSDEIMIVAATGNAATNVYWPAAYEGALAVAATDDDDTYATFSNYGPEVDLAAPGVDILSADDEISYIDNTGTSMATPHVSALAGLISSLRPDFSNEEILAVIEDSAIDINVGDHRGRDDYIGHGRVDVYQSLLTASAGLQLNKVDDSDKFTFARYPVEYNVKVLTPPDDAGETLPVQGAVMHYKVIPTSSTFSPNLGIGGRVLTGADGIADIVFLAPITTGSYILRTQVGQESVDFPLMVYPVVSKVDLNVSASQIEAGSGQAFITVEAFDSTGLRMAEPIPVELEVDNGLFSNGEKTLSLVMNGGVFSTSYYADTEIGEVTVKATVAGVISESSKIRIESSTPNNIEFTSDVSILETVQGNDSAKLIVRVRDIYNNPMSSAYTVNLYTNVGSISPAVFQSSNDGAMVAILNVPSGVTEEAKIWAVLPNTNLIAKLEIDVVGEAHSMLPLIINGQ